MSDSKTLAIVAFVLAFVMPLVGLILGIVAREQLDESADGRGLATAAIWIGAAMIVLPVIFFIMFFGGIFALFALVSAS